jgi:hypothetical protein
MAVPKNFTGGERLFAEDLNDNFDNLDGRASTNAANITTNANLAANASNLTSGTVNLDRLPTITDAKISGLAASKLTGNGFPFKVARGVATGSDTGAVTITFPAGLFSSAPNWVATASDAGSSRGVTYSVLTASSVTFSTWRTDNSTRNLTGIQWIAIGS